MDVAAATEGKRGAFFATSLPGVVTATDEEDALCGAWVGATELGTLDVPSALDDSARVVGSNSANPQAQAKAMLFLLPKALEALA